ncbi:MAG: hypothetical protein VKL39_16460 [Leptolyngbyaceae bacterium]|nr:hypothetical protein [Leptolyngbyaceae bacterium]
MNLRNKILSIVLVLLLLVGGIGYLVWDNLFREVPVSYESPAEHFKYGSVGIEQAQGIPYWIWLVLPRLFPEYLPDAGGYASLGMTWEPGEEMPIGFTKKRIGFPRVSFNCATCHSTVMRESADDPIPTIYPAGPANTFNLQGYINFLGASATDPRFTSGYILNAISSVYELSPVEKLLYRFAIIPQTRRVLIEQRENLSWIDDRPAWGGGRIDPLNPPKFSFLGLAQDGTIGTADMMSIWNRKMHQNMDIHWDGFTHSLTHSVISSAINDGATAETVDLESLERVQDYITQIDPPAYPFSINQALAEQGQPIFENSCAECHAFGGDRTGTVIPIGEINTDRHRLDMWTPELVQAYRTYGDGYEWDFETFKKTNGYAALPLDGLWLRSPYLHNGSVPSVADLLKPVDERPSVFYRAYEVYDPDTMSFVSNGAEAEKNGFRVDTNLPGNGNQGHLYGIDLAAEEKAALIEYLKTL